MEAARQQSNLSIPIPAEVRSTVINIYYCRVIALPDEKNSLKMYNTNWTDEGRVKQEAQLMLTNLPDQSRSPNTVPFHMLFTVSYYLCVTE